MYKHLSIQNASAYWLRNTEASYYRHSEMFSFTRSFFYPCSHSKIHKNNHHNTKFSM